MPETNMTSFKLYDQARPCHVESVRKALLKADPTTKVLNPNQARCRLCAKMISLGSARPYQLENWEQHQLVCPVRRYITSSRPNIEFAVSIELRNTRDALNITCEQNTCIPQYPLLIAHSIFTHPKPTGASSTSSNVIIKGSRDERRRKAYLELDPTVKIISPSRVACRLCATTINLKPTTTYSPANWQKHRTQSCPVFRYIDETNSINGILVRRTIHIITSK